MLQHKASELHQLVLLKCEDKLTGGIFSKVSDIKPEGEVVFDTFPFRKMDVTVHTSAGDRPVGNHLHLLTSHKLHLWIENLGYHTTHLTKPGIAMREKFR
jgi:hypothetical protein